MDETPQPSGSRISLATILIVAGTVVIFAAIVVPIYLGTVYETRRVEELAARPQPVLDALIEAEKAYKEQHGKFWRDREQQLSPEATKEALGVDLATAPDFSFWIDPPDLVADPTLRVSAKGRGEADGITIACVYDAVGKTKSCKRI